MTTPSPLAALDPTSVHAALAGDADSVQRLVTAMTPIVQARVARGLLRRSESRGRDIRQDVADLTQEVFVALFTDDAKALKAWNPALGLSLANFVGLLAQRKVASILRTKRRMPWTEEPSDDAWENVSRGSEPGADTQAGSRELLQRLFEHLQASLSPRGLELFNRLYVDEQSIEDVCAQTGLNASSVYQWKSRLGQTARTALLELQAERTGAQLPPGGTAAAERTSRARRTTHDDESAR